MVERNCPHGRAKLNISSFPCSPMNHECHMKENPNKNSWFKNSAMWLAENIFDLIQLNLYKLAFEMFLESVTACHKSNQLIIFFLRHSWFKNLAMIGQAFSPKQSLKFATKNQVDSSIFSSFSLLLA